MLKSIFKLLILLSPLVIFNQCDIINPKEDIPAYIYIDSINVVGDYNKVGSKSHNIVDAWVFVDQEFIGAFELPVNIPILASGEHELIVQAGIEENGISNTRVRYPFYDKYSLNYNFKEGNFDTLFPEVPYIPNQIDYFVLEDFENPLTYFEKSEKNTSEFVRSGEDAFEKEYSLRATLDKQGDIFEIKTIKAYDISRSKTVFMELNFKTDVMMVLGYYAINFTDNDQHGFLYLNPTDKWKKVYVNMGTEMNFESTINVFKFFIGGVKSDSTSTSKLYIDNVKLLKFE